MSLTFELGDPSRPRGHALVYFIDPADPDRPLATYVIVPPVAIQLSKYLPPMFASQLPLGELTGTPGAMPIPPLPEPQESMAALRQLASARDDDLVAAGSVSGREIDRLLARTVEAAQEYQRLYELHLRNLPAAEEVVPLPEPKAVLYELMSEQERLTELARLAGMVRHALTLGDPHLAAETTREMETLVEHLPAKYRGERVIAAANLPGERGARLLELYLERCFKLAAEQYGDLPAVEEAIRAAEAE